MFALSAFSGRSLLSRLYKLDLTEISSIPSLQIFENTVCCWSSTISPALIYSQTRLGYKSLLFDANMALMARATPGARSNVRPYVRSSTDKLTWTVELHQSFVRAVIKLDGKHKATPKKILKHMNTTGITIAHIKSHLQMYRMGKSLPHTDYATPNSIEYERSMEEAREVHMALNLLKKGMISGAAGTESIEAFKQPEKVEVVQTRDGFVPVMEEPHERCRDTPRLESFLGKSSSIEKGAVEELIDLNLTLATRVSSPVKLQFPCPSSPEEATLCLGLS